VDADLFGHGAIDHSNHSDRCFSVRPTN